MSPPTDHERAFAVYLKGLVEAENRGALAALRRGIGKRPGEVSDPCAYVDPWLRDDATRWEEQAHYLVATLFALHQGSWPEGTSDDGATNLGASFERLVVSFDSASIGRRFVALLNADGEDLAVHLRGAVGLLKAKAVPIDWAQLLHDLLRWRSPRRDIQRQWARAFWKWRDPESAAGTPPGGGDRRRARPAPCAAT